ncbi:MBL fold metallo-hydrolase [Erythrobacter sp. JK5]|uniref:MBL fold metallo-hydrolase n=1 Tax=Erythrobacter sp. JK5 TaxID=2829500 RepID=UPI001BAA9E14|nr:MBL fold metallo-hydrolase [Erythrobacter sp. JK5]QUL37886.1 MBL fold metallo-hydrolase [Erythrobacter sp. JK5]
MHYPLISILLACCLLVAACDDAVESAGASTSTTHETGVATSILNAGVAVHLGKTEAPAKFLFDPLYDDHFGSLEPLDNALIERIVTGAPPYDNVAAVFVSHAHGDHFSATHLNRMLAAQPGLRLVAPAQAIEEMRRGEGWDPTFAVRIEAISLENGARAETFEIAGARIEAFRSPHAGYPDRHRDVHNITYRVTAAFGTRAVHRVMHFGDADPGSAFLAPHADFLSRTRTGLAIVPFWFLSADDPQALIGTTLNAEAAVGMHVPVREPEWLEASGWEYFSGEGQTAAIPATR